MICESNQPKAQFRSEARILGMWYYMGETKGSMDNRVKNG